MPKKPGTGKKLCPDEFHVISSGQTAEIARWVGGNLDPGVIGAVGGFLNRTPALRPAAESRIIAAILKAGNDR